MQKIFSPVLNKFIEENKLANDNGAIVFDSIVKFKNSLTSVEVPSTVHLVTLANQHINVIYLFYPDGEKNKLRKCSQPMNNPISGCQERRW